MNVPFMRQWISALRSDQYQQIFGVLYRGDDSDGTKRMCVLGVGLDVLGAGWWCRNDGDSMMGMLSWQLLYAESGLSMMEASRLVDRNNRGESFASLADHLETLVDEYEGKPDALPLAA